MRLPLGVEVLAPRVLRVVARAEVAVAQPGRPRRPGAALALAGGAEAGVVLENRVGFHVALEGGQALAPPGEETLHELLQRLPLERHRPAVIHQRRPAQRLYLPPEARRGRQRACRAAVLELGNAGHIQIEFVPE